MAILNAIMDNIFRTVPKFRKFDATISKVGISGYAIALGITNVTPTINYTTYPDEWTKQYIAKRYAWLDPVVQYTAFGVGAKRWSELQAVKLPVLSNAIMERAKNYGLKYGMVVVRRDSTEHRKKHMLSVARSDRELTDREVETIATLFDDLLSEVPILQWLTDRQIEVLSLFAQGLTRQAVALQIGLSEDTVKKDVEFVRRQWGAKNTTEAVGDGRRVQGD